MLEKPKSTRVESHDVNDAKKIFSAKLICKARKLSHI